LRTKNLTVPRSPGDSERKIKRLFKSQKLGKKKKRTQKIIVGGWGTFSRRGVKRDWDWKGKAKAKGVSIREEPSACKEVKVL